MTDGQPPLPSPPAETGASGDTLGLHVLALGFALGGGYVVIYPFWPWIVVSLWTSELASGVLAKVTRRVRDRGKAAVLSTLGLMVAIFVPVALTLLLFAFEGLALVRHLADAGDARRMLEALVSAPAGTEAGPDFSLASILRFTSDHGAQAWAVVRAIAGATTHVGMGLLVFVVVAYVRLAHAPDVRAWVERHAPIRAEHIARLTSVFFETGRGLFVGIGGAGLAQAAIATAAYALLGVPRAPVLGVLTLLTAVVPGVGAAFIWLPVAAGLALTGRTSAAAVLVLVGIGIVGTVDNLVKPLLARHARLDLPASLVLVAMLGGLVVAGPSGILLGPIVVRVAKELIAIAREERDRRQR